MLRKLAVSAFTFGDLAGSHALTMGYRLTAMGKSNEYLVSTLHGLNNVFSEMPMVSTNYFR